MHLRFIFLCEYCGKAFEPMHYGQRDCNAAHRQRAYELRKAARECEPAKKHLDSVMV